MLYLIEHITHYTDCYLVEAESEEEAKELIQDGTIQPFAVKNHPDENQMIFTEAHAEELQKLPIVS